MPETVHQFTLRFPPFSGGYSLPSGLIAGRPAPYASTAALVPYVSSGARGPECAVRASAASSARCGTPEVVAEWNLRIIHRGGGRTPAGAVAGLVIAAHCRRFPPPFHIAPERWKPVAPDTIASRRCLHWLGKAVQESYGLKRFRDPPVQGPASPPLDCISAHGASPVQGRGPGQLVGPALTGLR